MLNDVDNSSGVLIALADNGYAISEIVETAENISANSTADVFESGYSLLAGNRVTIVVGGEYIKTTIEEAKIISEGPFQYDTSAITAGAIPSEVFFTGDLRIEVVDIAVNFEISNISTATVADTLTTDKVILESDNLLVVTNDDKIHKVPYADITEVEELSRVRYIRDYINGSSANVGNHWVEIQALEVSTGTNRALASNGATISGSSPQNSSYPYSRIIDGSTNSSVYAAAIDTGLQYVQIDMGGMYDIETLKVWHYNLDGRTYYETRTQVSIDGVEWFDVYDSAVSGTYQEVSTGKIMAIIDGPSIGGGSIVDTSLITNGEIPTRAYYGNVVLSFNGIEAENRSLRYSIIADSDNIAVTVKKRGVVSISHMIETRIDFISAGDKMIDLNYNSSILLNDRYLAPEFALARDFPDVDIYQTITFDIG